VSLVDKRKSADEYENSGWDFTPREAYSKTDVAVSLRILRAVGDVAASMQDDELRRILFERAKRVVDGYAERLGAEELKPMLLRLRALETLVVASNSC
jgi:hypothetical protein